MATDAPDPDEERRTALEEILRSLNLDWSAMTAEVQAIIEQIVQDGAGQAIAQIEVDVTQAITDHVNEAAAAYARDRGAELVGRMYDVDGNLVANPDAEWAITESTRDMLRGDLEVAINEGWSTAELADRLSENYAFSAERAGVIARTEVARADVEGNLALYRASGIVSGKELILSDGHDEDDECDDAADLGIVNLDDDFGGNGDPPLHPSCECDVIPVIFDDAGDAEEADDG